ncbi:protein LSM14B-B-like [Tropilaelaps mercedesae]|uniref:Protein LSM14B-B-like n=1 Tax=Tropilaelaps mercedesae TaxID=418985 RepID=A0A1V9X151_9ACAR|nr:protein LSM14B-B-like [Tropilaelaps mercedesae]
MGTEQRVASIKVQPASDFYGFIVFNVDYIKSFQPITRDHYVVPSLLTTSGTSFAKVNEDKCIADSKSGVYSSPKGTVLSSYRALATISKKCDSVQGDCQRLRSTDVNRPAANDRIVFKKNGHYVSHQQQQQTNKGSRHVSFMNPDQLAESRSDIRRLSHIPQVPRCFMSGYGNRNNTYLGRSKRHKQENGINSQNKILALPRRQRSGSQYKPGEFAKPKTTMKFQVEFDFDKALEEFKELSLNDSKCHAKDPKQASSDSAKSSMESNDSATNEPKECYNREKCFYDNLSNASLTPGQLRRSRKDEIMVNRETFGVSWIPLRRRYFHIRPGFYGNGKRFHGGRNFDRRASGKN